MLPDRSSPGPLVPLTTILAATGPSLPQYPLSPPRYSASSRHAKHPQPAWRHYSLALALPGRGGSQVLPSPLLQSALQFGLALEGEDRS